MKHQPITLILSATLATQAAELIIKKPHYMRSSTLVDASDWRRQVVQPAQPTLPSNYWWPYASQTWAGGTATTTVMPLIVPPTTVPSPTVSSDSTPVSSTPTPDISPSSTTSSSDLTTTTIDPQQTDPTSHVHVSRLSIPIIASIAGVAVGLGVVLILLLCRCCARRRREHTTRRTSRRRRDRDAEKGWRRVSIDKSANQQQQRSWWNAIFSTRGEEVEDVVPGPRYVGVDNELERSILLGLNEVRVASRTESGGTGGQLQDKLLLAQRSIRRPNHLLSSQPLMSSLSMSTTALALGDEESDQVDDEDDESKRKQVPWESLRHKSIKRAILAKVDEERKWTDSMRGMRAANAAKGVGRRQTHVRYDSDFWLSSSDAQEGGGFRIVAESPPQIPTPPSKTWTSLASSFPFFGADEEESGRGVEDRYTPAPARMRSNSSRRGSITSPLRVMQRRTDTQVFLRSPPTVTSPEMESALCFTPVLSASKSDWRIERSFALSDDIGGTGDSAPGTSLRPGQERIQGQRSRDMGAGAPGTAFTKTYRLRTDHALKRVEAIVESGWTERGVATRIGRDGV